MSGNGIILLTVAGFAAFTGMAWERARRSLYDLRRTRRALDLVRETASKEQSRAAMYVVIAAVVIFYLARNS